LRVGCKGCGDEGDQRDDDAEPGNEREQRGGVVCEMDEAMKNAGWQSAEVRPDADVSQPLTPSPALPALTVGRGCTCWHQARTWSQRRSSSWAGAALA